MTDEILVVRQPVVTVLKVANSEVSRPYLAQTLAGFMTLATAQAVTAVKTFTADPVFNDDAIPATKISGLISALALFMTLGTPQAVTGVKTFTANPIFNDAAIPVEKISGLPGSLAGFMTLATAQTATGAKVFQASGAGVTPLTAQGFVGQTAALFNAKDSAGVVQALIASNGDFSGRALYGISLGVGGSVVAGTMVQGNYGVLGVAGGLDAGLSVSAYDTNTGRVPLKVRGAVGQVGDLFQAQSSAGSVLSKIWADGRFTSPALMIGAGAISAGDGQIRIGSASPSIYLDRSGVNEWLLYGSGGNFYVRDVVNARMQAEFFPHATQSSLSFWQRTNITPQTASQIGLVVKGFAGQTANLQEWQDPAGAMMTQVSANGSLLAPWMSIGTLGFASTRLSISTGNAAYVGQIIRGAVGQTADLFQAQDSAGVNKFRVLTGGLVMVNGAVSGGETFKVKGHSGGSVAFAIERNGSTDTSFNFYENGAASLIAVPATAGVTTQNSPSMNWVFSYWNGSAAVPRTWVTGTAAYGGSAHRWHLTAPDGFYSICAGSDGGSVFVGGAETFPASTSPIFMARGIASATARTTMVAKGVVGQTANRQEWQDSAGVVSMAVRADGLPVLSNNIGIYGTSTGASVVLLAGVDASNNMNIAPIAGAINFIRLGGLIVVNGTGNVGIGAGDVANTGSRLNVTPASAAMAGSTVRGFAGQTADLERYQDSSGVSSSLVDFAGRFVIAPGLGAAGKSGLASLFVEGYSASLPVAVLRTRTTTMPILNLESSASALLTSFDGSGRLTIAPGTGAVGLTGLASLFVQSQNIGDVVAITRGRVGQTGDLFQAQDSAGAVLGKISAVGDGLFGTHSQGGIRIGQSNGATFALIKTESNSGTLDIQGSLGGSTGNLRLGNPTGTTSIFSASLNVPLLNLNTGTARRIEVFDGGGAGFALTGQGVAHFGSLEDVSYQVKISGRDSTARVPLGIFAMVGQTADLQQHRDSAGSVISRTTISGSVGLAGQITVPSIGFVGNSTGAPTTGFLWHAAVNGNDLSFVRSGVAERIKMKSEGWLQLLDSVAPASNPVGSGYMYSESGALKWRGSAGTVTTLAAA